MGSSSHSHRHHDRDRDRDRDHDRKRSSTGDSKKHSSSRNRDRDDDNSTSSRSSKRHRSSKDSSSSRHRSTSRKDKEEQGDNEDEDEWVEKESTEPTPATTTSKPPVDTIGTFTVGESSSTGGRLEPEDLTDGYGEGEVGSSSNRSGGGGMFGLGSRGKEEGAQGEMDFFGGFGTEQKRREPKEKPDPSVSGILREHSVQPPLS